MVTSGRSGVTGGADGPAASSAALTVTVRIKRAHSRDTLFTAATAGPATVDPVGELRDGPG